MYSLSRDIDQARGHLDAAVSAVQARGFALTAQDAALATSELAAADAILARAQGALRGDPLLLLLGALPVSGEQIGAVDAMVEAIREVTSRHEQAEGVLTGFIAARDGGGGANRIAAFARFTAAQNAQIDELLASIQEADRLVSELPVSGLLGPVANARSLLSTKLDQARPAVSAARQAVSILPSLLGVGGQKRYIVYALDNAEIRPIGGLIVAFATPRFRDGVLEDATFRDILSIDRRDQEAYVPPPQPLSDHLLGEFTWQVADAGWWPDFPTSAAAAKDMYELETGDKGIQGTIAFTPEFVDALIAIVGPVHVPEAGVTVHPGETYLLSLEQVEILNRGEGRKAFLANLASQVLERLFELPPSRYADVVEALANAGERRQLQMAFDDPPTQAAIDTFGWSGRFSFPPKADRLAIMEANVAPVSKLNVLLTLDHALDVQIEIDGSATEKLVTRYTNNFGPRLSPELERVRSAFFAGMLGSYNRRYLDPRAEVTRVVGDAPDAPITDPDALELESGCLTVGNYQFVRPGIAHLITEYTVPDIVDRATPGSGKGHVYRLAFRKQPGRDLDTLTVMVTVPAGMKPMSWSEGGVLAGDTVTFTATTELDHVFEVEFGSE